MASHPIDTLSSVNLRNPKVPLEALSYHFRKLQKLLQKEIYAESNNIAALSAAQVDITDEKRVIHSRLESLYHRVKEGIIQNNIFPEIINLYIRFYLFSVWSLGFIVFTGDELDKKYLAKLSARITEPFNILSIHDKNLIAIADYLLRIG
jgi:hypothetical protein